MTVKIDGKDGRSAIITQVQPPPSSRYKLAFMQGDKEVDFEYFSGGGTKDGDISAQQEAQDEGEAWAKKGKRQSRSDEDTESST